MAEPFDTVDALSPEHWWRFSDVSGPISNDGLQTTTLQAVTGVSGAFNGDYRFESSPSGAGFGLRFEGQGGLRTNVSGGLPGLTDDGEGTMIWCFRTDGTLSTSLFHAGFFSGTDFHGNHLSVISDTGLPQYSIQDNSSDDESFRPNGGFDLADDGVHTLAITPGATVDTDPLFYVDGILITDLDHTDNMEVPDNYWWQNYDENVAVGIRTTQGTFELDNMVMYDLALFNTSLTDLEVKAVHDVLVGAFLPGVGNFTEKTQRVTNRRLVFDF